VVDRLPVRFAIPGDTPLRVQVADDAAFDHVLLDRHFAAGEPVTFPALADGAWHLRVRRISPEGLEGLDAVRDFTMRARPDAPALTQPAPEAKLPLGDVTLRWTEVTGAPRYTVEVARDAGFTQLALRAEDVAGDTTTFHPVGTDFGAPEGAYWWRVTSANAQGARSAVGAPQRFVLRPAPRAPFGSLTADGSAIELRWGDAGGRVEAQLSSDTSFATIRSQAVFTGASGRFPRPSTGTWQARIRVVEPDGFTTAWSEPVPVLVPSNWHEAWRAMFSRTK
jgi:hypothetical protein